MAFLEHHPAHHWQTLAIRAARQWLRFCTIWMTMLTLWSLSVHRACSAPAYSVPQVKAVFLFNFAQFVDWPSDAFENETSPLVIGVVGDREGEISAALEQVVKNEKIKNRPFRVVRFPDIRTASRCHILYLSTGIIPSSRVFADLQGKSILTVGESEEMLRNGGVIRFVTERKISLRVNLKAAKNSRLTISSKLLRLAEIVDY